MSVSWSGAKRIEEDGDTLDYRDTRSLLGLGGTACERLVPNEYDQAGALRFDWQTLSRHAGQGPCRYWFPFSNAMSPHTNVPYADNPDYEPALNSTELIDYLITERGLEGRSSLLVVEGLIRLASKWSLAGGPVEYAVGAQLRQETYDRREYSKEVGARGGALQDLSLYPCQSGPALSDCEVGRLGVFSYLPPGHEMDAERSIYSAFAEVALPLADFLDAQVSLRYEDYRSEGGASLDPKLGFRWQVSPNYVLRFSAGTTFRAPTLNQTQTGIAATSRQFVSRIGTFKPILAFGNPELEPEQATTFNAGLIFDTDTVLTSDDWLLVSLDFWRYTFDQPLVPEPYVRILDLACPSGQATCDASSPFFERLDLGGQR